ncbi:hypothetical protein [Aestuariispira insulae]|uniref:Uncharacterized protein n=1 Tax=Aestuariispira insulae TaxID=1461337 RepID=A0A3D9H840_9PROT|nr:hypothetical protein [Aestuariispira insulae]RED45126.1 hypothetical protein DFP90_112120 [Aestuariispira insulae]
MTHSGIAYLGELPCRPQTQPETQWWIDDSGRWLPCGRRNSRPNSQGIKDQDPFSDPATRRLAYHRLGMVHLSHDGALTTLSWDLREAAPQSLNAALDYLINLPPNQTIRLCFFYSGWCFETFRDRHEALRRICCIRACHDQEPAARLITREIDISLMRRAKPLIRDCYQRWLHEPSLHRRNPNGLQAMHRQLQIFSLHTKERRITIDHIGDQTPLMRYLGPDFCRKAVGSSPASYEDPEQESALSGPYWRALEKGRAYYDHVRSLILPKADDPVWFTYQRLIMPLPDKRPSIRRLAVAVRMTRQLEIPFLVPGTKGRLERISVA